MSCRATFAAAAVEQQTHPGPQGEPEQTGHEEEGVDEAGEEREEEEEEEEQAGAVDNDKQREVRTRVVA